MSAKWRRSRKHPKRLNIFKVLKKVETKKAPKVFRNQNWGNKRPSHSQTNKVLKIGKGKLTEPEPLIDVLEERDEVVVVADFAGFNKENLKINLKSQRLFLSAETSERKYHKSLNLPTGVIPNSMHTAYKNGVLEIRLKKTVEEKAVDRVTG